MSFLDLESVTYQEIKLDLEQAIGQGYWKRLLGLLGPVGVMLSCFGLPIIQGHGVAISAAVGPLLLIFTIFKMYSQKIQKAQHEKIQELEQRIEELEAS